tara:strand:+ start:337 stop:471 length:135 start_codon:yes stop_codon:yes gene_type:complete
METFGLTMGLMTILVLGMSFGLLANKPLRGSCGGLNCRCKNGTK